MIECKICGHKVKYRLIEHIIKTHKLKIEDYKREYGKVVSDEYKQKVSNKSKEKWKDQKYRSNVIESRKHIYLDKKRTEKISKSLKKYYLNGGSNWNKGLTKEIDSRVASIGEKNSKKLKGRTKEDYPYLKKHSDLMKSNWEKSNLRKKHKQIINDPKLKKEWSEKISNTISKKILDGSISTMNNFKNGWYLNDKGRFWYSSELALSAMKTFDLFDLIWENNKKYRFEYVLNDSKHYYIPDFIVYVNSIEILIEMKGFDWDGLTELKKEKAKENHPNYKLFYSINDLKKFLNETIKN